MFEVRKKAEGCWQGSRRRTLDLEKLNSKTLFFLLTFLLSCSIIPTPKMMLFGVPVPQKGFLGHDLIYHKSNIDQEYYCALTSQTSKQSCTNILKNSVFKILKKSAFRGSKINLEFLFQTFHSSAFSRTEVVFTLTKEREGFQSKLWDSLDEKLQDVKPLYKIKSLKINLLTTCYEDPHKDLKT